MRPLVAALLLATAAACASAHRKGEPDLPPVTGAYRLVAIDHRALPATSPTEPNVIVHGGQLILDRSNAFTLTLLAQNAPQLPGLQRNVRGTYSVAGDRLTLSPTRTEPGTGIGAGGMTYRYWFAGGRFLLRDAQGHEYEFAH
jgi:hypothetical protein